MQPFVSNIHVDMRSQGVRKNTFFNMHTRTPCRTTISIVALMASHTAEVISQRALQFSSANRAPTLFYSHLTISQLSRTSLLIMLASGHPAIIEISKYYFLHPSNQVRPVICLGAGGRAEEPNPPLTRPDVLNKL